MSSAAWHEISFEQASKDRPLNPAYCCFRLFSLIVSSELHEIVAEQAALFEFLLCGVPTVLFKEPSLHVQNAFASIWDEA